MLFLSLPHTAKQHSFHLQFLATTALIQKQSGSRYARVPDHKIDPQSVHDNHLIGLLPLWILTRRVVNLRSQTKPFQSSSTRFGFFEKLHTDKKKEKTIHKIMNECRKLKRQSTAVLTLIMTFGWEAVLYGNSQKRNDM